MFIIVVFITAMLAAQAPPAPTVVPITGLVQDQTGAVLAGAMVELVDASGATMQTTADNVGSFRFDGIRAGSYQLRVTVEGFKRSTTRVRVGTRTPAPQ